LKSLSRLTDSWKEITMNFITDLSSSKWKEVMYDLILVIVNHYIKMTRYLLIKKTLTVVKLTELFFEQIALRYEILNDIIINRNNLFINVFWSEICYHAKIKWWLSIVFHLQTDDQTEQQNQTLKHYLSVYCLEKQDDWATLLLIVEFRRSTLRWAVISLKSCMTISQSLTYTLRTMLWKKKCQQQLKCCKMCETRWRNNDKTQLMFRQSTIIKNISLSFLILMI